MARSKCITLTNVLSSKLIPESLQSMCSTSLKLIESGSSNQVSAAVEYNQHNINVLLIQLLTINFISQNQQDIENEVINLNHNNNNIVQLPQQLNPVTASPNQLNRSTDANPDFEEYCQRKLLCLSPILGFSRKNYFVEYNMSNDIQMEIVSYLKPIEIFKNVTLINKQFNKNVQTMHESYKYASVFCSKHYVFESFNKLQKYCDRSDNDEKTNVDWRLICGRWVHGQVDSIDPTNRGVDCSAKVGGQILTPTLGYRRVAPAWTMSYRPGNKHRFVNILKHGYCSETCDVNLKNVDAWTQDEQRANVVTGYVDPYTDKTDIWRCGWIDFEWTWGEAIRRNEQMFGVTYNDQTTQKANEQEKHKTLINEDTKSDAQKTKKILENSDTGIPKTNTSILAKNKKFQIFQVGINVDITQEYNKHDDLIQASINEFFSLHKTREDRWIISLVFHIDDIDNFTYFGSKTTLKQQLEIKKYLFNAIFASYNAGGMDPSKVKLLNAVNYPNYCVATPCGIFYAMSDNLEEKKQFNKWYAIAESSICESECINLPISDNALNKVYYDKEKDELCVKVVPWFEWILDDSNAPLPLEKRYIILHGNQCRLIEAKIVDPGLIDKLKMEHIEDVDKKEERYFELLREWKGFIMICVDITIEFNQFQERIKNEYIKFHGQIDENQVMNDNKQMKRDNRKYFLNNDEMSYLKWNKKEDKITHDVYILLESKMVHSFDSKFNFFDTLEEDAEQVLENVFGFVYVPGSFDSACALVCKDWHRITQNLDEV